MNVKIQTVRFNADKKLIDHINQKLESLKIFMTALEVDVFLKLDNVIHNIKDKIAEIRVTRTQTLFFCKNKQLNHLRNHLMKRLTPY